MGKKRVEIEPGYWVLAALWVWMVIWVVSDKRRTNDVEAIQERCAEVFCGD